MNADEKIRKFVKERNEACSSFDLEKFKKFCKKYKGGRLPSDEVLEISMRKMVVNIEPRLPQYDEAKKWLLDRGYDLNIF